VRKSPHARSACGCKSSRHAGRRTSTGLSRPWPAHAPTP
jgi:hypothetical protein